MANPEEMYQCQTVNCGYIYNPDKGDRKGKIPKGTQFEDLPQDWKCPVCGAPRNRSKPSGRIESRGYALLQAAGFLCAGGYLVLLFR